MVPGNRIRFGPFELDLDSGDLWKDGHLVRLEPQPLKGKWTAREILTHLAQTEIGLGYRARMVLTNQDYTAQPFDQDLWVARESALSGPAALEALVAVHAMNDALFASLSPAERATPFAHPDYGTLTVDWIAQLLDSHLAHHLVHLERIAAVQGEIIHQPATPHGQPLGSSG